MSLSKNILFLFFSISISAFGQSSQKQIEAVTLEEVIRFEGITYNGNRIFGIYATREQANKVITDYMSRNKKTVYRLIYKIVYSATIEASIGEDVFATFTALCPKEYRVLPKEDYNALMIMDYDTPSNAIWYYMKVKNIKEQEAKQRITQLKAYRKYLMD